MGRMKQRCEIDSIFYGWMLGKYFIQSKNISLAKAKDKDKMTAFNSAIGYANLTNGYELIRIGQISLRCGDVSRCFSHLGD